MNNFLLKILSANSCYTLRRNVCVTLLVIFVVLHAMDSALSNVPNPCASGFPKWTLDAFFSPLYGTFTCVIGLVGDPVACYGEGYGLFTPGTFKLHLDVGSNAGGWEVEQLFAPNSIVVPVLGGR